MSANNTSEQEGGYEPKVGSMETSLVCRYAIHPNHAHFNVEHDLRTKAINAGFIIEDFKMTENTDDGWRIGEAVAKVRKA